MGSRHGMLLASGDARRYCSGYMPALNSYTYSLSSITFCMSIFLPLGLLLLLLLGVLCAYIYLSIYLQLVIHGVVLFHSRQNCWLMVEVEKMNKRIKKNESDWTNGNPSWSE